MTKGSKVGTVEILACDAGWRNYHFVKVTTEDGVIGWSEFDEGFGSPGVGAAIQRLSARVIGQNALPARTHPCGAVRRDPSRPPAASSRRRSAPSKTRCSMPRQSCSGVPCYELLGGKIRDRIRVYWSHCATWRINHPTWYKPPIERPRRRQGDRPRGAREEIHRAEDQHLHL